VSGLRRAAGFTLLEVMAAVLVLGLLYTVLAETAMRGLRSEGISRRRTEASLLADDRLSQLELQLALGEVPKSGEEEEAVDPYRIVVRVQPYDPSPLLEAIEKLQKEREPKHPAGSSAPKTPAAPAQAAAAAAGGAQGAPTLQSLFTPPRAGEEGRFRRIDVSVAWPDGDQEESVSRTTFAFDTSGLDDVFPGRGKQPGAGGDTSGLEGLSTDEQIKRMEQILNQMSQQGGQAQ